MTAPPAPEPPVADSAPSPQQPVSPAGDPAQALAEPTAAAPTQQLPPAEPARSESGGATDTTGAVSAVVTAEPAAIVQPTDRAQPVAHTTRDRHLATKRTKSPRRKIVRKVVAPRQVTVVARRVIRTRRVAPAFVQPNTPSFAYSQPTFQAAPQSFQQAAPQSYQQAAPQPFQQATPQLVQRTALLRPRRVIKKAVVRRAPVKKTRSAARSSGRMRVESKD
jgi:hypothetical protein